MTEPAAVPLSYSHTITEQAMTTHLTVPGAAITITIGHDIGQAAERDVFVLLGGLRELLPRLWEQAANGDDIAVIDMRQDRP